MELSQSILVGIKSHWGTMKNVLARFLTIGQVTAMAFLTNAGASELCVEIYAVLSVGQLFLFLFSQHYLERRIGIKINSLQPMF